MMSFATSTAAASHASTTKIAAVACTTLVRTCSSESEARLVRAGKIDDRMSDKGNKGRQERHRSAEMHRRAAWGDELRSLIASNTTEKLGPCETRAAANEMVDCGRTVQDPLLSNCSSAAATSVVLGASAALARSDRMEILAVRA